MDVRDIHTDVVQTPDNICKVAHGRKEQYFSIYFRIYARKNDLKSKISNIFDVGVEKRLRQTRYLTRILRTVFFTGRNIRAR